ncbi:hypothetical protein MMC19_000818 [Ptychographa xylographoides]|nr:hypothetical protein [Ptychographa xylographoides]
MARTYKILETVERVSKRLITSLSKSCKLRNRVVRRKVQSSSAGNVSSADTTVANGVARCPPPYGIVPANSALRANGSLSSRSVPLFPPLRVVNPGHQSFSSTSSKPTSSSSKDTTLIGLTVASDATSGGLIPEPLCPNVSLDQDTRLFHDEILANRRFISTGIHLYAAAFQNYPMPDGSEPINCGYIRRVNTCADLRAMYQNQSLPPGDISTFACYYRERHDRFDASLENALEMVDLKESCC